MQLPVERRHLRRAACPAPTDDDHAVAVEPDVSRFKPQAVYSALIDHQKRAEESDLRIDDEWTYHELAEFLDRWARTFIAEFRLEIPVPPLNIEWLPARRLGHYRPRNGFGLRGEVAINVRYLGLGRAEMLDTLLHELIHLWQDRHGRPGRNNYHNGQFRAKARELGLNVDDRGRTAGPSGGPFTDLLARHGIEVAARFPGPMPVKTKTKLRLWVCGCSPAAGGNGRPTQRARIGRGEFFAVCPFCEQPFRRVDC